MEVYALIGLIEAGRHDALREALASGVDANVSCPYTGMTALLAACERNDEGAVEILLAFGADPDLTHRDGYTCYDSSGSGEIKRRLVSAGYSLPKWQAGSAILSAFLRCFSVGDAVNRAVALPISTPGVRYTLEYKVYDFPPGAGAVHLRVEPGVEALVVDGSSGQAGRYDLSLARPEAVSLAIRAVAFTGELRVRLYDLEVLKREIGPLVTEPWP